MSTRSGLPGSHSGADPHAPQPEVAVFTVTAGSSVTALSPAQRAVLAPIRFYRRYLSPLKTQPSCRFSPTCSRYALQAVTEHGALRGLWLSLLRLLKCHPFHPGGFDPVPPSRPSPEEF